MYWKVGNIKALKYTKIRKISKKQLTEKDTTFKNQIKENNLFFKEFCLQEKLNMMSENYPQEASGQMLF